MNVLGCSVTFRRGSGAGHQWLENQAVLYGPPAGFSAGQRSLPRRCSGPSATSLSVDAQPPAGQKKFKNRTDLLSLPQPPVGGEMKSCSSPKPFPHNKELRKINQVSFTAGSSGGWEQIAPLPLKLSFMKIDLRMKINANIQNIRTSCKFLQKIQKE